METAGAGVPTGGMNVPTPPPPANSISTAVPTPETVRLAEARYAQPTAAYSAKMLFGEVADVQMAFAESMMGSIVWIGVIVIVVLGLMVWNNAFGMKARTVITLCLVLVMTILMTLLREKTRNAFLKVKNAGNRMVDGFAHLNTIDNIAFDFELNRRSTKNDLLTERVTMRQPAMGMGMGMPPMY